MTDENTATIIAAMQAVTAAAAPLQDVVGNPLFQTCAPGSVAVWALNHGFELTADQVRTLASAIDLFMFALTPPASDARH